MKKGVIVIGNSIRPERAKEECLGAFVVGVDKGAWFCYQNGIPMDVALGDFDSLSPEQKEVVLASARRKETLNPVKDDTDTAHALAYFQGYDRILLLGGIQGKRIEHFLANLDLLCLDSRIEMLDDYSLIKLFEPGEYEIRKDRYMFFSFFPMEESVVSLRGFAYPLETTALPRFDPFGISNQLLGEAGSLVVEKGSVLMVASVKD